MSSSVAQPNELDDLINTSSAIVAQIKTGVLMTGTVMAYANTGAGLSNGEMAGTAYISTTQVEAYNSALSGYSTYLPYGSSQTYLEEQAQAQIELMNEAVETFVEVVVDILAVQEIAELSAEADTPDDQAALQTYIADNTDALTIDQADADIYNSSLDSIEGHANSAASFIAVANNEDATAYLDQAAMDGNTTVESGTLSYSATTQAVSLSWDASNTIANIYVNGTDQFSIDLYVSNADILSAGAETQFYTTSPTALGYRCFVYQECDEEGGS